MDSFMFSFKMPRPSPKIHDRCKFHLLNEISSKYFCRVASVRGEGKPEKTTKNSIKSEISSTDG